MLFDAMSFVDLGSTTDEAPATALFVDLQLPYIDGKLRLFSEGLVFRAPGRAPIVVSMRPSTASPAPSTMTLVGITEIPSQDNIFLLLIKVSLRKSVCIFMFH